MILFQTIANDDSWAYWVKLGDRVWYCQSDFSEKDIPKAAGFSFHGKKDENGKWIGKRIWWTSDKDKATKLADYAADPQAEWAKELSARKIHAVESLVGSRQSVSFNSYPHPEGYDYFPFQKAGIDYMLRRQSSLLADDMGIGKTIEAIGVINADETIKTVLVISPATLKLNWQREMGRWLVRPVKIGIADTKVVPMPADGYNVVITNYEAVGKTNKKLSSIQWDLLIIDEAHYLKNMKTVRYQSIMGTVVAKKEGAICYDRIQARRKIFTTGTPIVNCPAELWPLISAVDPEKWNQKTFWYYHKRYCNVQAGRYGTDFKGAASQERLEELQVILRERCMIRRMKSEVLTELPPKIRQVVELEYNENDGVVKAALTHEKEYQDRINNDEGMIEMAAQAELAKATDNDDEYKTAIECMSKANSYRFEEMARIRHETAVAKIPYAIEYLKEQLEVVPKAVVFFHHHEVGLAFQKAWSLESVLIYGEVNLEDRQAAVDRFQSDPACKLAVVSIKAGGLGITLTAASHVYVVELPWTPGDLSQAEDRLHRISQADVVNVYHLVLRESIDVKMAATIISKQKIIEAALDKITEREPVLPLRSQAVSHNSSRKQIAEAAAKLTQEQIEVIHEGLKSLAGNDGDFAHMVNGVGFSKIDARIGHSLAECVFLSPKQAVIGAKLIKKYRGQIQGHYERVFGKKDEEW
jgi:SWI/SNF-related matrix-associated actin-dependent regulator 1 of chromatin subfamily A